jgi:hypothetical protein
LGTYFVGISLCLGVEETDCRSVDRGLGSVRGVGIAQTGLAATESAENQFERAVQLVVAAEVYAHGEGIVIVYLDEIPGRGFIEQARAGLSVEAPDYVTEDPGDEG